MECCQILVLTLVRSLFFRTGTLDASIIEIVQKNKASENSKNRSKSLQHENNQRLKVKLQ